MRVSNDIFIGVGNLICDNKFKNIFKYEYMIDKMSLIGDLELITKPDPVSNRQRKVYRVLTLEMRQNIAKHDYKISNCRAKERFDRHYLQHLREGLRMCDL